MAQRKPEQFDTVIIGTGMGGLTAARLLQEMRGDRVLLLERHTVAGGMTHEFTRRTELGEFAFSTGLHYLGDEEGPTAPRTLISFLTGGTMQWARMPDAYDVYHTPSGQFRVPSSFEELSKRLETRFPKAKHAIRRYYRTDLPRAAKQLIRLNVVNSLPPFLRKRLFPIAVRFSKLALSSTAAVINARFNDSELKSILAFQWGDYGRSPQHTAFGIHARIVSHYAHGAVYPIGGSMRIARKATDMIERSGGEVRVGQEVRSIIVENGRAKGVEVRDLATGTDYRVRAKNVVSSAGAKNTYDRLLKGAAANAASREINQLGSTISAVVLFVGFKKSPRDLGFDGANYWTFTDGDHEAAAIAPPGNGPLYFSFASLKNPAARSHVAEIVSLCDLSHFEKWSSLQPPHDDPEYQVFKDLITNRMLTRADELFPGFREATAYTELATPLTFRTYQNSMDGAFYGLPASPERLLSPYATPRTPIKNLYLAGQDALVPGIIGAAAGGARCVGVMLGGDKTPAVFKTIMQRSQDAQTTPWNGFLRIARIVDETPTIRSFYLTTLDGEHLPFSWKGGQYLNVYVPTEGGKKIRSYSISSAYGQFGETELRLTIKREPEGGASPFIHDHLREGELIEVAGPHGSFTFDGDGVKRLALIGGGVGVTPLMSVLEELILKGPSLPVTAVFAFRSRKEILFCDRLMELGAKHKGISIKIIISDESDPQWEGPVGRITKDVLAAACPQIYESRVHLCGPVRMMEALTEALSELGVPEQEIRTESFGSAAPKPRADKGKSFTVQFTRSGATATGTVGDTILDVALREEVVIPHACGVGTCGTCKMRVTSGEYEAPPTPMLSDREVENGYVLACKARPQADIAVDI